MLTSHALLFSDRNPWQAGLTAAMVPMGMEYPGSYQAEEGSELKSLEGLVWATLRSPERLAPSIMPTTAGKITANTSCRLHTWFATVASSHPGGCQIPLSRADVHPKGGGAGGYGGVFCVSQKQP